MKFHLNKTCLCAKKSENFFSTFRQQCDSFLNVVHGVIYCILHQVDVLELISDENLKGTPTVSHKRKQESIAIASPEIDPEGAGRESKTGAMPTSFRFPTIIPTGAARLKGINDHKQMAEEDNW